MQRIIISGGGTGGHIYPALSIAGEIRRRYPECELLFIGAEGRMEAEKVPEAGYPIRLLPVRGLERGGGLLSKWRTLSQLLKSIKLARKYIEEFRPEAAVGVGGYASAPTLIAASKSGIPTLVQEQNSFAGKTNKLVGRHADVICVAYEGMERFFPAARKIVLTGNPTRKELRDLVRKMPEAYEAFGLDPSKKTLLVLGGSLGARSVNLALSGFMEKLGREEGLQVIWQCGKGGYEEMTERVRDTIPPNVRLLPFITRMDYAYSVADLVVSRAGAGSISELTNLGLPKVLVPSPNVAEDHQTRNAEALALGGAAIMVRDLDAVRDLIPTALETLSDEEKLRTMAEGALRMALPNAAEMIVDELELLTQA